MATTLEQRELEMTTRNAKASEALLRLLAGRGSYDPRPVMFEPPKSLHSTTYEEPYVPLPTIVNSPVSESRELFDVVVPDHQQLEAGREATAQHERTQGQLRDANDEKKAETARTLHRNRRLAQAVGQFIMSMTVTWITGLLVGLMAESVLIGVVTTLVVSGCVVVAFKSKLDTIS